MAEKHAHASVAPLATPDGGWGDKWLPIIQAVINIKEAIPEVPTGPITPVWGAHERSIWGSEMSPIGIQGSPQRTKALNDYNQGVLNLQATITKLREERGIDDPEYLEAQRLYNLAFR